MSQQSPQKVLDRIMNFPHKEKGCSYICGPHLEPCECCGGTGVCPKCHGAEKELTGEVISLCKCGVWLRTDISICPRCEKPYFADGRTIAGRHA